jgi:exonuclease III
MINGLLHQEDKSSPKGVCIKQRSSKTLIDLKREKDKSIFITGDFNIHQSVIDAIISKKSTKI